MRVAGSRTAVDLQSHRSLRTRDIFRGPKHNPTLLHIFGGVKTPFNPRIYAAVLVTVYSVLSAQRLG